MNEEFYKNLVDYLMENIEGLWVDLDKNSYTYSWGYIPQNISEREIEKSLLDSYEKVVEDIVSYIKIVK